MWIMDVADVFFSKFCLFHFLISALYISLTCEATINYVIFLFLLLPPSSPIYASDSLPNPCPLLSLLSHIFTIIYYQICKYNVLSLYDVTCKYVSRADHLVLDNQLVCCQLVWSSWGTLSPPLSAFLRCLSSMRPQEHPPPYTHNRVSMSIVNC